MVRRWFALLRAVLVATASSYEEPALRTLFGGDHAEDCRHVRR